MLTTNLWSKEEVRQMLEHRLQMRYGEQFTIDDLLIVDEEHETTTTRFSIEAQIIISHTT